MTDSEKITDIQKKFTTLHILQGIVVAVVLLNFLFGAKHLSDITKK